MTTAQTTSKRWPEVAVATTAPLFAPVCVFALVYQLPFLWLLCPQSLIVMFLRHSMSSPDSLGAAGFPDIAVAALYYPILGLLLLRAFKRGSVRRIASLIAVSHLVAILLAVALAKYRNTLWWGWLGD